MLLPRKRLYKRIEFPFLVLISVGVFILFLPHAPIWTAASVALIVFIVSAWAGL